MENIFLCNGGIVLSSSMSTFSASLSPPINTTLHSDNKTFFPQDKIELNDTFSFNNLLTNELFFFIAEQKLKEFIQTLLAMQVPPDPEIDKAINDNLWDLLDHGFME
jgi:hypothetical protein